MKVILLQDIKGVGKKDEVIQASDGYARNFLLPRKMAVEANAENMTKLKGKKDSQNHKKELEKEEAQKIQKKLEGILLKIKVKAGENGKVFGGVTAKEISENLKAQYQIEVDKKKIDLKETIKTIGTQKVSIKLFEGIIGELRVDVLAE
ncbi:MAG TPA: 50S ribosomal protein L9 [Candidatus Merdicola faecigallinarum]|uniref:Large ribosomal subunit protein bL9 n=1 Tax=Candidatus Merdicola faecigallinarum TaxID=2840862 RepID=A0A9D1M1A6_9FIRM|nr:50S ribosomal protein L9 [Candidatus Merdicola faecigallinarum]